MILQHRNTFLVTIKHYGSVQMSQSDNTKTAGDALEAVVQ